MCGNDVFGGMFDAAQVSALLRTPAARLVRWATVSEGGQPVVPTVPGGRFSFVDLTGLRVVSKLSKVGVSDDALRGGAESLSASFRTVAPYAHVAPLAWLTAAGDRLFAGVDETLVKAAVMNGIRGITFDDSGVPVRWAPAMGVLIDPQIQSGAPCIAGTRIRVSTIAERNGRETLREIADDLGVTVQQAEWGARFAWAMVTNASTPRAA